MALASRLNRLSRGLNRRLAYVLPLAVLLGAVWFRLYDPIVLKNLRSYAFDTFQSISPRPWAPDMAPVRIVDIDEASLREYGQWPWSRNILAELFAKLSEMGAAVIAFDGLFAEPDRSSPSRMIASLAGSLDAAALERLRSSAVDNDEVFAEAIRRSGRVVLGFVLDGSGTPAKPKRNSGLVYGGDDPALFLKKPELTIKNLDILEEAAQGVGSIMTEIEDVVRYVPLLFMVQGSEQPYPSLSLEALRVLIGDAAQTYFVRSSNANQAIRWGAETGIVEIRVGGAGGIVIPTTGEARVQLYDTGHKPERFVSAAAVLAGKIDPEKINGHLVFVGSSSAGLKDLRNTPIASAVPGVEIHAQIVEQILLRWQAEQILKSPDSPAIVREMATRSFLFRPDYAGLAEGAYLVVVGLLVLFLLPRLSPGWMALVGVVATGAGLVVPWLLFRYESLLFDPIYPPATVAAMYLFASAFSFIEAELNRAQIRGAFGMYLTPALVEQLARNPDKLQLGGETREITVMFTDVRGFTTISEGFDAQELTSFMNRVLTPMTDIILSSHGTIDKYMGDAIMAFWNAPLDEPEHADRACGAALEMQARLKVLNREWQAEADKSGRRHVEVHIGVGLNSGPASVGNFGSTQRFSYSVMGDAVNLASRLEGQCKTYAVDVVLGEKTRQKAPQFAGLEIDLIMVKGKTVPERVFTLVGRPDLSAMPAFKDLEAAQARVLERYRAGRFDEAIQAIAEAEQAAAALEWSTGYFAMMRERCHHLIEEPPENWNGVFVAKEK